jgi:microcin C transport system permease protein
LSDPAVPRVLGFRVSPLNYRRWQVFRANKRGFRSLWIFLAMFFVSLFSEVIANDRPVVIFYDGAPYFPFLFSYPETTFGGEFETETEYRDPFVADLIEEKGTIVWPPIRFRYDTVVTNLDRPVPAPPSSQNWLGTDDQARDVVARLLYGFRISIVFGFILTAIGSVVGIIAGAVQGYFAGWVDLLFQRFLEIWESLPDLYILIILSSLIVPGFWPLLVIMLMFFWTWPVGLVRAEFLRARNFDYVRAAQALGVSNSVIMVRHVLPNAMVSTLTYLPFTLAGSVTVLVSLDFLGVGLPPGSPSLGELLLQAKGNLHAPWLGFTAFFSIAITLILLSFIGEAVRDAFDPRKTFAQ